LIKILVIEDQAMYHSIYRSILEKEGWEFIPAFDGEEGLRLAEAHKPNIILLDLMMPKMDGIEFLRSFKPKNRPETKVVVLSNIDIDEYMKSAMALGAANFLIKANYFTPKKLVAVINEALGKPSSNASSTAA
jgi:DNA-binding NarL/FixJ family response regulator